MKKVYEAPQLLTLAFEAEECLSVSGGTQDDNVMIDIDDLLNN